MNIGVMGYYGYGNAGDEAILENIVNALNPHEVVGFPIDFPFHQRILQRLNAYDYLILGGGGLYNQSPPGPFASFEIWKDQLTTPIGVLGLGVEKLDAAHLPATHALVEHAEFFVVRDLESKDLIGHPKVQLAPDISFLCPPRYPKRRQRSSDTVCGVNLRPFGSGAEDWLKAVRRLPGTKRAIPLTTVPIFNDRELLRQLDPDCPKRFDRSAYGDLDILIGTAFHSIAFAVQAGVPVVAISYHPKVRRLMNEIGLSDYVLAWEEHAKLDECYLAALANRQSISQRMQEYTANAQQQLRVLFRQVTDCIEWHTNAKATTAAKKSSVTVLIDCDGAVNDDIHRSLVSCGAQTHQELKIAVARGSDELSECLLMSVKDRTRVTTIVDNVGTEYSKAAEGADYVLWLTPGHELAQDAISVWVEFLERTPDAESCYSDCYLTDGVWILHRIASRRIRAPEQLAVTCPCFMVRGSVASDLLGSKLKEYSSRLVNEYQPLHIPFGLVFRPASQAEQCCIAAAVAFGRGRIDEAQSLVEQAGIQDSRLLVHKSHQEEFFGFFRHCAFSRSVSNDPIEYFQTTRHHFPATNAILRRARTRFISRVSFEEAHLWQQRGDKRRALNCLVRCIMYDRRWLLDRGLLSFGARIFP